MQLFLLSALTMLAFAMNSILNRVGVAQFGMDPVVFAVVRTLAGCVMLAILVGMRGGGWPDGSARRRFAGGATLAVYMAGFSFAYLSLDAGVGALILFGGVQLTMFAGALIGGDRVGRRTYIGCWLALVGLLTLVWPSENVKVDLTGVLFMCAAAFGWGLYSLLGRGEARPLEATAANFIICLPLVVPALLLADARWTVWGLATAVLAGAVTSGLGYALWYRVVPMLGAARAAVTQLSVPLIAAGLGVLLLSETVGLRFAVAAMLVLGGIGLSLWKPQGNAGSRKS